MVRPSDSDLEKINEVEFSVKQRDVDGRAVNRLRDLIGGASRTDTAVIALTELSAVLHRHPKNKAGKPVIDTLQVLAEAIADIYLQERSVIEGADDMRPWQRAIALGASLLLAGAGAAFAAGSEINASHLALASTHR